MANEIERKYRLTARQREEVLKTLNEAGAEYSGEDFEENIIFTGDNLAASQAVLRLRRIGKRTILTYKQRVQSNINAKHHVEYETEVENFEEISSIFEALGYRPALVYEKRRRIWNFPRVEVVLDTLPFGEFMEIEGPLTAIVEAEMVLDAGDFEVEPDTYPNLTLKFGKKSGALVEARFNFSEDSNT